MSFNEAIEVKTEEEIRTETSADLADRGVDDRGFPTTSTQRALLDNHSASMARLTELRSNATKAGSVDLIEEIPETDGRDLWIGEYFSKGYFGLSRDEATRARHRVVLTNSITGIERAIATGKIRVRGGGIDFVNSGSNTSGTLPPGGTLAIEVEAQTTGSSGNLPPNTITQLVTAIAGVTVNNPPIPGQGSSIVRPARDDERNETLLARDMARWGATSVGGSRGSLIEWIDEAFKFAGVTKLVTKWGIDDENPLGPGSTVMYLGTDSGAAPQEQVDIVTEYYTLRRSLGTGKWVAMPATELVILYAAQIQTKLDSVEVAARALSVDTTYTAQCPIGGKVLRAEMIRRLKNAFGLGTQDNLTLDLQDIQLAPFEMAVFAGSVSGV